MTEAARYETISPAVAATMLANNGGNRPMRATTAADYAAQMKRGEWGPTAQPIILDGTGRVIDGQHRLSAVAASGTTQRFLVVRGADPGQFLYIDRHAKRKGSDVLAVRGEQNTIALAACLSWCEQYERRGVRNRRGESPTGERIVNLAARWPEASASVVAFAAARGKHRWMQTQAIAAGHAIATKYIGRQFADRFLEDLATGAGLAENDPAWRLRELLVNNNDRSSRASHDTIFRVVLKAICLRAAGRQVRNLKITHNETFPIVPGDLA